MGTTPLGIVYPDSTDNTQLWTHFQTMADDVDDAIQAVIDDRDAAFGTYTPVITGSSSGTWTAGNATFNSTYFQLGRLVFVWGELTLGTTSSITAVTSGSLRFSLPVTAKTGSPATVGIGWAVDTSAVLRYTCTARLDSTTQIAMFRADGGSTIQNNTVTWANTDVFGWHVSYEAASAA